MRIAHIGIFLFVFICFLTFAAYCQSPDQVTITTYYPAPYGEYQQLRLTPAAVASGSACNNNGAMTYSSTANALLVCSAGIWQPAGGGSGQYWMHTGTNIHLTPTYSGYNIGVGVTNPMQKLDVGGNIRADSMIDRNSGLYWVDPDGNSMLNNVYGYGGNWLGPYLKNLHAVGLLQHHDGNYGNTTNTWHQLVLGDNGGWAVNYNRLYLRRGDGSYSNEIKVNYADKAGCNKSLTFYVYEPTLTSGCVNDICTITSNVWKRTKVTVCVQ